MKIHSSSLALAPAKTKYNELNQSKTRFNFKNPERPLPPVFKEENRKDGFQKISKEIEKQQSTLINTYNSRAINAYIYENTQLLKIQRSELMPSIDLFA